MLVKFLFRKISLSISIKYFLNCVYHFNIINFTSLKIFYSHLVLDIMFIHDTSFASLPAYWTLFNTTYNLEDISSNFLFFQKETFVCIFSPKIKIWHYFNVGFFLLLSPTKLFPYSNLECTKFTSLFLGDQLKLYLSSRIDAIS